MSIMPSVAFRKEFANDLTDPGRAFGLLTFCIPNGLMRFSFIALTIRLPQARSDFGKGRLYFVYAFILICSALNHCREGMYLRYFFMHL